MQIWDLLTGLSVKPALCVCIFISHDALGQAAENSLGRLSLNRAAAPTCQTKRAQLQCILVCWGIGQSSDQSDWWIRLWSQLYTFIFKTDSQDLYAYLQIKFNNLSMSFLQMYNK